MANDRRSPTLSESSVPRGVHGGLSPDFLPSGYLAGGANITVRGGSVSTRPRFKVVGSIPADGAFQGVGVYSLASGDRLIFGMGAKIYELDPSTGASTLLFTFPTANGPHYYTQADRYFIIQNDQDRPVFHHRGEFTRQASPEGDADRELPTGSVMAYAHGRTFIVPRYLYDPDGNPTDQDGRAYWMAGDILLPLNPENVLKVTEDEYWNEGGATSLPFEAGNVTAMAVLQNAQASGTGLGALLAFGRTGVSAYVVAANRSDWKNLDFSQVLFTGVGTTSPKSLVPVNDDLIFRSPDGIRSLRTTAQQTQGGGGWSIRPISYEVEHRLTRDLPADLPFTSASFADNRFLLTTGGRTDGAFAGLVSLDTLVSASLTQGSPPAYDDIWIAAPVLATVAARVDGAKTHVVIFQRNGRYDFAIPTREELTDFGSTHVTSRIYTRAYSTQSRDLLSITNLDVIFRGIQGPLVARAYYRTDFYERWTPFYGTLEINNGQTRRQVRFSTGQDGCREDGTPPHVGQNAQLCIEWTGVATVERWSMTVNPEMVDPSQLMSCNSTFSVLSPGLDEIMVTLDDLNDLKEIS